MSHDAPPTAPSSERIERQTHEWETESLINTPRSLTPSESGLQSVSDSVALLSAQVATLSNIVSAHLSIDDISIRRPSAIEASILQRLAGVEQAVAALQSKIELGIGPRADKSSVESSWITISTHGDIASITAAGDVVCQLRRDGSVWRLKGWHSLQDPRLNWELLDANVETVEVAVGAGGQVVQRHANGLVYEYQKTPQVWKSLDEYPEVIEIRHAGSAIYLRHRSGAVHRYTGRPNEWEHIDRWDHDSSIRMVVSQTGKMYVLRHKGSIYKFEGHVGKWKLVEGENDKSTVGLVASGRKLYQLRQGGSIREWGEHHGWRLIGQASFATQLAAGEGKGLYRRDGDGSIFKYGGEPHEWSLIGNEESAVSLVVASGGVYVLRNDGIIKAFKK